MSLRRRKPRSTNQGAGTKKGKDGGKHGGSVLPIHDAARTATKKSK